MNLEFELKRFFREDDCPRFNQDVKASICKLGTDMVYQVALHMHNFRITRLLPRHVPYLIFQLCQDPYTVILRNGDAQAQRSRIKDLSKILSKVLEDAQVDVEHKKNGNIDRKIVRGVVDVLKSVNLDTTQKAAVMVAACIAEVCGILLNAAYREADRPKTLNDELVWRCGINHKMSSNGEECKNTSLVRLISALRHSNAQALMVMKSGGTQAEERKRFDVAEEKMVSFPGVQGKK